MSGSTRSTYSREQKLKELIRLIPGPDFPTGGMIVGKRGIHEAYLTGRGSIQVRARTEIETTKKGDRQQIVVTEIPYQLNKTRLLERIAELVREKTIEGISDLRDESDRDGMRIVIELKRGEVGEVVLNNLFKQTQLQQSFGIITLAIVAGRPKVLSLLEVVEHFIDFRRDVVRRRIEFELRKAEARAHILEGLKIALDHLDAVIKLIRGSKNPAEAKTGLIAQFGLSEIQSQAILDMQLQRLTGLERDKILSELATLQELDREAEEHPRQPAAAAEDHSRRAARREGEVRGSAAHGADRRRRRAQHRGPDHRGRRRGVGDRYRLHQAHADHHVSHAEPRRQGPHRHAHARRGRRQPPVRGLDALVHDDLLGSRPRLLAEGPRDSGRRRRRQGQVDREPGADGIRREARRDARRPGVRRQRFVVMGTRKGTIKKTELSAFANPRAGGIIAMGIEEGDAVIDVQLSDGQSEIFIGTKDGKAIRFVEGDVRAMGRTAYGVRGIQLRENDEVVAMQVAKPGGTLLTVTEKGYAKNTLIDEYRVTGRGGLGVKNVEVTDKNGAVVAIAQIHANEELLVMTEQGKILRTPANEIRTIGRATQGVRLMDLEGEDKIVSVALVEAATAEEAYGRTATRRRRLNRHRLQETIRPRNA